MIYTLGESLLDIILNSPDELHARPGGAMLNTAVSLARSGIKVSLISELGDDDTAQLILDFLKKNRIVTKAVKKYYHHHTTVALAFLNPHKVPSFSIYRSYPLQRRLISPGNFTDKDILIFGSLYSLDKDIRADLVHILITAKRAGTLLIYDPNIRTHNLNEERGRQALEENITFADLVKGSDDDFKTIFGEQPPEDHYNDIRKINPDAAFILTLGAEGVIGFRDETSIRLPAEKVNVVSTIGAGDAFTSGMAYFLNQSKTDRKKLKELSENEFRALLQSGIKFSSAVCGTMENYVPVNFS